MSLGPQELLIILIIVLVLFGGAKLPKLAKSLGEAQKEFKKGQDDADTANSKSTAEPVDGDNNAASKPETKS